VELPPVNISSLRAYLTRDLHLIVIIAYLLTVNIKLISYATHDSGGICTA